MVISTYVEMIPNTTAGAGRGGGDLHVCGDDPNCTIASLRCCRVISTYVEMILPSLIASLTHDRDLHVCGDDPTWQISAEL